MQAHSFSQYSGCLQVQNCLQFFFTMKLLIGPEKVQGVVPPSSQEISPPKKIPPRNFLFLFVERSRTPNNSKPTSGTGHLLMDVMVLVQDERKCLTRVSWFHAVQFFFIIPCLGNILVHFVCPSVNPYVTRCRNYDFHGCYLEEFFGGYLRYTIYFFCEDFLYQVASSI